MSESPLVSILIPCYNAESLIEQAIESALSQTYEHKEIIVVDDGSSDNSLDVIKTFDDRIRWASQENQGGNVTRNRLLELSQGDWLQYLDADDYLLPQKIATQVRLLTAEPDVDVIFSPSQIESHAGETVSIRTLNIPEPHDLWVLLVRWYLPQTGASLWRRSAIKTVGGWKDDQPCCQEHELYLRLLQDAGRFHYCPGAYSVYRHWGYGTVSTTNEQRVRKERRVILDKAEAFLSDTNTLSHQRRWAINMGRFEMARKAWCYDREEALQIVSEVQHSDPSFIPKGEAAPDRYRLTYRLLGFERAETIADWFRPAEH